MATPKQNSKWKRDPDAPKRDYVKEVADKFIEGLNKDGLKWVSQCVCGLSPMNGASGHRFAGMNWVTGLIKMMEVTAANPDHGHDPRFVTFKQAKDNDWKMKKGAKSIPIVFYKPLSANKDKDAAQTTAPAAKPEGAIKDEKQGRTRWMMKIYPEFHASDFENAPPITRDSNAHAEKFKTLDLMLDALRDTGLKIEETGEITSPHYQPTQDILRVPPPSLFKSDEAFWGTTLHEVAHATFNKRRLDKSPSSDGVDKHSPGYAKEELAAEIASTMMSTEFGIPYDPNRANNNHAYVNGWCQQLAEKPFVIYLAARDAQASLNYCMEQSIEYAKRQGVLQEHPILVRWDEAANRKEVAEEARESVEAGGPDSETDLEKEEPGVSV
jgi:antirestriction protein ArdC